MPNSSTSVARRQRPAKLGVATQLAKRPAYTACWDKVAIEPRSEAWQFAPATVNSGVKENTEVLDPPGNRTVPAPASTEAVDWLQPSRRAATHNAIVRAATRRTGMPAPQLVQRSGLLHRHPGDEVRITILDSTGCAGHEPSLLQWWKGGQVKIAGRDAGNAHPTAAAPDRYRMAAAGIFRAVA